MSVVKMDELVGWVVALDEASEIDGKPCRLYLTVDGLLTPNIEGAECLPDFTERRGRAFFSPRPGAFSAKQKFVCLKVLRTIRYEQETRLL